MELSLGIGSFVVMLTWVIHTRLIKADKKRKFKILLCYLGAYIIIVTTMAILYWQNVIAF